MRERMKNAALVAAIVLLAVLGGRMQVALADVRISDKPRVPALVIASVYSGSAPGADTDILAADVEPNSDSSVYRVTVVLATASVLNFVETDGTTEYEHHLNEGNALTAECVYTFITGAVRTANDYNFRVETDGVIRVLRVEEVVQESF